MASTAPLRSRRTRSPKRWTSLAHGFTNTIVFLLFEPVGRCAAGLLELVRYGQHLFENNAFDVRRDVLGDPGGRRRDCIRA